MSLSTDEPQYIIRPFDESYKERRGVERVEFEVEYYSRSSHIPVFTLKRNRARSFIRVATYYPAKPYDQMELERMWWPDKKRLERYLFKATDNGEVLEVLETDVNFGVGHTFICPMQSVLRSAN